MPRAGTSENRLIIRASKSFVTTNLLTLTELFTGSLEFKLMRKVCVNILVIRRVAVQILMRVYLTYLKAGVCYDAVEAEIFKRRYVAAHLGYDGCLLYTSRCV